MIRRALLISVPVLVLLVVSAAAAWDRVERAGAGGLIRDDVASVSPVRAGLLLGTSPKARNGRANRYFESRIVAAASLFQAGKVAYIIASGDRRDGGAQNGGYDEPAAMTEALVAAGVPPSRICRDNAGFRTIDSVMRAKQVFGVTDAVVISQGFHVARALYLAQAHGLSYTGFAAADVGVSFGFLTICREVVARVRAVAEVYFEKTGESDGAPVNLGCDGWVAGA